MYTIHVLSINESLRDAVHLIRPSCTEMQHETIVFFYLVLHLNEQWHHVHLFYVEQN